MNPTSQVGHWLDQCRPVLPLQNPLWAFVHNNILQHFEPQPFLAGVREAAALYRARPFEREYFYRRELERGRLRRATLEAVLEERLPQLAPDRVEQFLSDRSIGDTLPTLEFLRLAPRLEARLPVRHGRYLKDLLVPLVATHLDQGIAPWPSPLREERLWTAFVESVERAPDWSFDWIVPLRERLHAHAQAGRGPEAVCEHEVLLVAPKGREVEYCLETLFELKGWSGAVARLEADPKLAPLEAPPKLHLVDWLAMLLVAQHALDDWILAENGLERATVQRDPAPIEETRGLARMYLWQLAYERSFGGEFLAHLERGLPTASREPRPRRALVQALVCMDDREESLRRALELPGTDVETWGAVGFFGLDMNFAALGAAQPTRQCPPVIEPSRTLREVPIDGVGKELSRAQQAARASDTAHLSAYYHSRTLFRGVAVSLGLGLLGFVPLVAKVLMPARVNRWRRALVDAAFPHPPARIELEQDGYSLDEQARIVDSVLRTCGLMRDFAPIVAVVGHGSTSANNPFRQAYGCGACCGNSGAPNSRAFAAMANDPRIRERLVARGLEIPAGTLFVPCLHDTSLDTFQVLDETFLPAARAADIADLRRRFDRACSRNAQERGLRLEQGPGFLGRSHDPESMLQHVEDRGHDLAQPRPEYGHNRVATCIVGRRELTESTSLDRRTFLVSYDPSQETDGSVLAAAVLGSVPVAVNIAMDYYFSRVDPDGFGAGSKLPLNVVSLLGVITGSKSDLRIGLARQMVELHEPMRVLVLLEATEEHVLKLVHSNARLTRLVNGHWMQLGRIDPNSRSIELWTGTEFRRWRAAWPEFAGHIARAGGLPAVLDPREDTLLEVLA